MAKRPYSRAFPKRTDTPARYLLDAIPPTLWARAKSRARQEHVSMRGLILHLLTTWLDGDAPAVQGDPDKV